LVALQIVFQLYFLPLLRDWLLTFLLLKEISMPPLEGIASYL
jgi:hypothetical protein